MENDVTQRVMEFQNSLGLSALAFSKAINVSSSTLNQQLRGRNGKNIGVHIAVVAAILNAYPNLSAEWLMRGEGNMIKGEVSQAAVVNDVELVAALRDHIATLKETNRRLVEENAELKREKSTAARMHGYLADGSKKEIKV